MVGTKINLHYKVTPRTYETDYQIPCISATRGHQKRRKLRLWVVCACVCVRVRVYVCVRVCVCVCVCDVPCFTAGSFPGLFMSKYDTHEADTLGRNSYISVKLKTHNRTRKRRMGSRRLSINEQTNSQRLLFRHNNGRLSSVYRNTHTHTRTHVHTYTYTYNVHVIQRCCPATLLFFYEGEGRGRHSNCHMICSFLTSSAVCGPMFAEPSNMSLELKTH